MSKEQDPLLVVGRAIPLGATLEEGARRTVTKDFDTLGAIPFLLEKIESARKQARAELRDRFAMAALTGLLAAGDAHAFNRDEMAAEAWRQADAMLKARGDE